MPIRKIAIILLMPLIAGLLTGCGTNDFSAYIRVANDENAGGENIVDIYIAKDCTEDWGVAKASVLDIAPNDWSNPIAIFWEETIEVIHPALDDDESDGIIVDVRACFTSGTCGDEKTITVSDDEVKQVIIRDEGKPDLLTRC
ncbi:MAG: hypothetical protein IME93_02720 [Proteobacteria bacterium]|nr:hypothetical protein [Pseudomonadota bacterium]